MADSPPPLDDVEIEAPTEPLVAKSGPEEQEVDEDENLFADALQSPLVTPSDSKTSDSALEQQDPIKKPEAETTAPPPTLEPTVTVQDSPETSKKPSGATQPMDLFGEEEDKPSQPEEQVRVVLEQMSTV